ncbi:FMRFamide receptor-like [Mya arenaria]|uniref:FMRFamide receptor-like n=1 Tax=Mya arenaria TaxID=6604 RepID=UPI0022E56699|nr:FMRFamide receptor-like [Mya arenaria]
MDRNCSSLHNSVVNISECLDQDLTGETNQTLSTLERYIVPFIAVIGILGNLLAFIVFLRKPIRNNSSSFFLAARCLSDAGFLLVLMVIWVSTVFELYLSKVLFLCKALIFSTYVFGCLSVWLVILVTAENYTRICKPFLVHRVCKTLYAKIVFCVILVVIISSYSFPFWTMTDNCVPFPAHYAFVTIMVYIDSVLTLFLPIILIAMLMAAMVTSTIQARKRRRRLSRSSMSNTMNPTMKVTTMLFAVTVTFIVLNIPSHSVRLWLMVSTFLEHDNVVTSAVSISQTISSLLYYLSMSINVIIYYIFGIKFRGTLNGLFLPKPISVHSSTRPDCYNSRERLRKVSVPLLGVINYAATSDYFYLGTRMTRTKSSDL